MTRIRVTVFGLCCIVIVQSLLLAQAYAPYIRQALGGNDEAGASAAGTQAGLAPTVATSADPISQQPGSDGASAPTAQLTTATPAPTAAPSAQQGAPAPVPTLAPLEGGFIETFDGAPDSPQPWRPSTWDVTVHTRDQRYDMAPMAASHGPDCAGPPATHTVALVADAVFLCRNHLMTAINDPGYGMIYLTPNQLVDFSTGEAVVRFDMSTLRTSGRDWADLWISPYAEHLQLPLEDWLPDVQGEPRRAIHIRMERTEQAGGGTFFFASVVREFERERLPALDIPYESVLTPDPARRDTFELRISRTHLRFGLPQYNLWWVDTPVADLGWDQGVVQLGHHAYNPTKCDQSCAPNTWHWDNVQISPAVPFTMVPGLERFANSDNGTVRLASPAPGGGQVRFTGYGQSIEVSFDQGRSWQLAPRARQKRYLEYGFQSYFMPIPAGVTSVQFRGQGDPLGNPWQVRDIAVWAEQSQIVAGSR